MLKRELAELTLENVQQMPLEIQTRIRELMTDYLDLQKASDSVRITVCPKCGHELLDGEEWKGGGYTQSNHKKMYKCPCCGKRFVYDHGQLSFYSHSREDVWDELLKDTVIQTAIRTSATKYHRDKSTIFRMRHKILAFLQGILEGETLSLPSEIDETYLMECHKGLVHAELDNESRTVTVTRKPKKTRKRGLSKDQTCVCTGIEREGISCIEATNMGRPSKEDIERFITHVRDGTYVWTDSLNSYQEVLKEHGCPHKILKGGLCQNQVDNLNTVNNLHSRIAEWIKRFRGISTIYVNRYAALFSLKQQYAENLLRNDVCLKTRLKSCSQYFKQDELMYQRNFDDPDAMEARQGLMSNLTIRSYSRSGWWIVYA